MAWEAFTDEQGRVYYFNSATNESTWEKPIELQTDLERALLKTDWKQFTAEGGKVYYFNEKTNESLWEIPEDVQNLVNLAEKDENDEIDEQVEEESEESPDVSKLNNKLLSLPKFNSLDEAKDAFIDLLRSHEVDSLWSFNKVIKTFIQNPIYWSIPDSLQRKEYFEEYLSTRTKEELNKEMQSKSKFKEAFLTVLSNYNEIKFYTSWETTKYLIEDEPIINHSILDDKDIKEIFDEYIHDLTEKHETQQQQLKQQALLELDEYVKSLNLTVEVNWKDFLALISSDGRFKQNKNFKSLNKLDLLEKYEKRSNELETALVSQLDEHEKKNYRNDRRARDDFKQVLASLVQQGKIKATTLFKDIYPLIEDEDSFIEICGRNGSSPLELFWDIVDELDQLIRIKKNIVSTVLFEDNNSTIDQLSKSEFIDRILENSDSRLVELKNVDELEIIYDKLISDSNLKRQQDELKLRNEIKSLQDRFLKTLIETNSQLGILVTDTMEVFVDKCGQVFELAELTKLGANDNIKEVFARFKIHLKLEKNIITTEDERFKRKRRISEVEPQKVELDY